MKKSAINNLINTLGQVIMSETQMELFPPPMTTCSIPDLPEPRTDHSLSLLSGGRLVVCGGRSGVTYLDLDSCISWIAGNDSWTPLYTMRYLPKIPQN